MIHLTLFGVFMTGLLAGTHCAGMCGGIVSALSISGKTPNRPSFSHLFGYSVGRILSYTIAGALMGAFGAGGLLLGPAQPLQKFLYIAANGMLIALGLYLAGIWRGVVQLEKAGSLLWKHIRPVAQAVIPVRSFTQAVTLGALWGWIPCGLVYSMLVVAFAWANPQEGALIMLAFGLGTLPNLLLLGYFAGTLRPWLQKIGVRLTAGLVIIGFGVLGLMRLNGGWAENLYGALCITPI